MSTCITPIVEKCGIGPIGMEDCLAPRGVRHFVAW